MFDMKKEVREVVVPVAIKTIPVIRKVEQIQNLADVIETIQDHILDDPDGICSNDRERIEWMVDLLDEFFQMEVVEDVRIELLSLARKGHIVRVDRVPYLCFTIIPNTEYEFLIDNKSMYYNGSLEDFLGPNQLFF